MFTSPTCAPCKVVKPVLEELAQERGFPLQIIEMKRENQETFMKYGVRSVPAIVCINGEAEVGRCIGPLTVSAIEGMLDMWGLI